MRIMQLCFCRINFINRNIKVDRQAIKDDDIIALYSRDYLPTRYIKNNLIERGKEKKNTLFTIR